MTAKLTYLLTGLSFYLREDLSCFFHKQTQKMLPSLLFMVYLWVYPFISHLRWTRISHLVINGLPIQCPAEECQKKDREGGKDRRRSFRGRFLIKKTSLSIKKTVTDKGCSLRQEGCGCCLTKAYNTLRVYEVRGQGGKSGMEGGEQESSWGRRRLREEARGAERQALPFLVVEVSARTSRNSLCG